MANTTLINRTLIRLSGEDVRGFLQGLVTNDTSGNLPVWAALLTAQGKALFDFLIWGDGAPRPGSGSSDVLIDCERDAAGDLAKRLTLYRLRRAITISIEPDLAVHWAKEGDLGAVDPRLPELGQRWLAPAGDGEGADAAWRAHRLSLGVTEGRAELGDGTTLWLECNAVELNGVSFSKGCYVGQENTARMHHRDKVNRKLVVEPVSSANEDARAVYPELGLAVRVARVGS